MIAKTNATKVAPHPTNSERSIGTPTPTKIKEETLDVRIAQILNWINVGDLLLIVSHQCLKFKIKLIVLDDSCNIFLG